SGIAKVEVRYDSGSPLVEGIEVYFVKPITRDALIRKLNLPQQPDAKSVSDEGKLEEFFGKQALLVLNYASRDATSGVSDIVDCSPLLFEKVVAPFSKTPVAQPKQPVGSLTGRWKGSWKNNKGEKGTSAINLNEEAGGVIKGDENGAQIVNGRRIGN